MTKINIYDNMINRRFSFFEYQKTFYLGEKMSIIGIKDIELIVAQCTNQKATRPEDIAGFALAYADAKITCITGSVRLFMDTEEVKNFILFWGELVDSRNSNGWRCTPVIFANGKRGLSPDLMPRAMEAFCASFANGKFFTASDAYKEFEEIHPFLDGNGRVGHILWAVYSFYKNGKWPMELPPNIFS